MSAWRVCSLTVPMSDQCIGGSKCIAKVCQCLTATALFNSFPLSLSLCTREHYFCLSSSGPTGDRTAATAAAVHQHHRSIGAPIPIKSFSFCVCMFRVHCCLPHNSAISLLFLPIAFTPFCSFAPNTHTHTDTGRQAQ